jgi:hypothetical protein
VVYVVTVRTALVDGIQAALKTNAIVHCRSSPEFIAALVKKVPSKSECAIIDFESVADAERIIDFVQSSPSINSLRLIAICSDDDYDVLPNAIASSLNGVVFTPFTAMQIAAVVASVCGPHDPAEGLRGDKLSSDEH